MKTAQGVVVEERQFPILRTDMTALWKAHPEYPQSVPWAMLLPLKSQVERNHYQTLERLAQRGGLSYGEILLAAEGEYSWFRCQARNLTQEQRAEAVMRMVEAYRKQTTA